VPELPDVEGFRRGARNAAGRRIEGVELIDPTLLRGGRADSVADGRFDDPQRHGKWLIMAVGDAEVLMHRVPPAEGWLTGARDAREPRCPRCPRCGWRLRRQTVAGRTTVWCQR
jgi:formamidopyrimidine-DNA glycosylase